MDTYLNNKGKEDMKGGHFLDVAMQATLIQYRGNNEIMAKVIRAQG